MSVFDEFATLMGEAQDPALDVAYNLVARAVLGVEAGTARLLDDLAADVCADDAHGVMAQLFGSDRLLGDSMTYDDPANSFVHQVVERGRGIPLTLSVIAIEVGRRKGVALSPIGMPGHFLVASATAPSHFFDPFHGGQALAAEGCRELYKRVTGLATWQSSYLEPINTRGVVLRALNNLKSSYRRRDRVAELRNVMALRARCVELADREAPEFARLMRSLN